MGSVLDKSDPSWPVLAGGQVEDLDLSLVGFLQFSWVGQVGPVVSGGKVGGLDLSGLIWEA